MAPAVADAKREGAISFVDEVCKVRYVRMFCLVFARYE